MTKNQSIKETFSVICRYAMYYGALLGLFWVFRYTFQIIGGAGVSDRFLFLFYLLNIGTLLLIYMFYNKFRYADPDNPRGLLECLVFSVMMCFFASFLEGVLMYAHFQFIDPAYFSHMIEPVMRSLDSMSKPGMVSDADFEQSKQLTAVIFSSKITYIIIEFIKNILLGLFMGLLLHFLVNNMKKKTN